MAGEERGPRVRLSGERKARFLEVLGQTGNRAHAAAAVGVEPRLMDQRREFDAAFDRQWREAVDIAHRRLSGASGPFDCPDGAKLNVIRRGPTGRLQLVTSGPKRWNKAVEDRYIAALGVCGCLSAAARAVGFSDSCVAQRRRKWPEFEARIQKALDEAETTIEFRCAVDAGGFAGPFEDVEGLSGGGTAEGIVAGGHPPAKFDHDFALRFLKWREEKMRGGGQRGRVPKPPPIEEVTERIVRKVEAIKRHRARQGLPPEGIGEEQ